MEVIRQGTLRFPTVVSRHLSARVLLAMEWLPWAAIVLAVAAVLMATPQALGMHRGRRWVIPAMVLVVVAVGFGVVGQLRKPSQPVRVTFAEPAVGKKPIRPGATVKLRGTVRDLPEGHALWIVSQPFDGTNYFVVQGTSVSTRDGSWRADDKGVGDESDAGEGFYYIAVDANEDCDKALSNREPPRRIGPELPAGCHDLDPRPIVRFLAK